MPPARRLLTRSAPPWLALALLAAIGLAPATAAAACHAVSPAGAGAKNGDDWTDALAGLPATLVRGDIYYLADGDYGDYTFDTADLASAKVELRKAQPYDDGSACPASIAAGWNAATMGSAQAVFTSLTTETDDLVVNGNGTSTAPGCGGAPGAAVADEPPTPSDCGVSFVGQGGTTNGALNLVYLNGGSNTSNDVTFEYVELFGSGTNNQGGSGDLEVFLGGSDIAFEHVYGHNSGCVYIQDMGDDSLVDHSYFWGTEVYGAPGAEACHGQAEFEAGGTNDGVRSNNVYRDITGTAIWTFASGGNNDGWEFYNNVVFFSAPQLSFGGLSDAALDCINGNLCTNFTFVQNTIVNCLANGVYGSQCGVGWGDSSAGGSVVVENNLFYSNPGGIGLTTNATALTEDYNSFLDSQTFGGTLGAHDVTVASGAPDPLADWQGSNFNLASDGADWSGRAALAAPYTVDVNGNPFTTDRGAYQYVASSAAAATSANGGTSGGTSGQTTGASTSGGSTTGGGAGSAGGSTGACETSTPDWQSFAFAPQTGSFTVELDSTPSSAAANAVTGLSDGPATDFTSLAAIVRFNPTGTIDARNDGAYAAATSIPYAAGSSYHFRLVVDVPSHTYSAYVTPPGSAEQAIGTDYAFRTEQAAVTELDDWALQYGTASHTVCNFSLEGGSSATTGASSGGSSATATSSSGATASAGATGTSTGTSSSTGGSSSTGSGGAASGCGCGNAGDPASLAALVAVLGLRRRRASCRGAGQ